MIWLHLVIGCIVIPLSLPCEDSGVIKTKCQLERALSNPPSQMFARINGTSKEQPGTKFHTSEAVSCKLLDKDLSLREYVELEMALDGDPPSEIVLRANTMYRKELMNATLVCSYDDIGPASRIADAKMDNLLKTSLIGYYPCDNIEDFKIALTGVPVLRKRRSHSKSEHSAGPCVTFSVKPEQARQSHYLGTHCHNGRYMYDEVGDFRCALCCSEHYWSTWDKECKKCSPNSIQSEANVWTSCDPMHYKMRPHRDHVSSTFPSTPPTLESIKEQTPGSPQIQTIPEKGIMRPPLPPKDLKIEKASTDHAFISWSKVPNTKSTSVEYFTMELKKEASGEKPQRFKIIGTQTWKNLTGLISKSVYHAKIRAVNSEGPGPWSDALTILTTHIPPALADVAVQSMGGQVNVTWTTLPDDQDMNVMVEYWLNDTQSNTTYKTCVKNANGQLKMHLPEHGQYIIQAFYSNSEGDGPKSKPFVVNFEKVSINTEAANSGSSWKIIVIAVAGIAFCIGVGVVVIIARRRKQQWRQAHHEDEGIF